MTTVKQLIEDLTLEERMLGCCNSNRLLRTLIDGIDKRSRDLKSILITLKDLRDAEDSECNSDKWLFHILTKGEAKKLNAICKAKTEKTRLLKIDTFIKYLSRGRYGALFNSDKKLFAERLLEI